MRSGIRVASMVAAGFLLQAQAAPAEVEAGLSVLAERHSAAGAPGCILALRSPAVRAERAFGLSSIEHGVEIGPETVFHAGSIAKQVTAAAILLLEAEGKLSIEAPLTSLVPEMARAGPDVRLRHLLEHSSGIRDYGELLLIAGGLDTGPTDRDKVLDLLSRQRQLDFPPGSRFSYSGSGYELLAIIVERVSGQSLADFAAARFFRPLGMTHTRFLADHGTIVPHRAQGYRRAGDGWRAADYLSDNYGAGGLFTTAADLLLWTENLRTGAVGGAQIMRRMAQPTRLSDGRTLPWGLGLEVGSNFLAHGGRDFGFQSYQLLYPEAQVAAVALCNGREIDAYELAQASAALALPQVPPRPPAAQPAAPAVGGDASVPNPALERFAGTFFNTESLAIRRITFADGRLTWARGNGTRLEPTGPNRFRFAGAPIDVAFSDFANRVPQTVTVVNASGATPTTTVYRRVGPASSDLTPYLGRFTSEETGTEYQVSRADGGKLAFRANPSFYFVARPQFADTFAVGEDLLIQFQRRGARAASLTISTGRARNVLFTRAD